MMTDFYDYGQYISSNANYKTSNWRTSNWRGIEPDETRISKDAKEAKTSIETCNTECILVEDKVKIDCNDGEKLSLSEYIKKCIKQESCDNIKTEKKENNLIFHNKLSNKIKMLI